MRAVTTFATAAIEGFIGWMLRGPRQHEADVRFDLGALPRFTVGESAHEGVQR